MVSDASHRTGATTSNSISINGSLLPKNLVSDSTPKSSTVASGNSSHRSEGALSETQAAGNAFSTPIIEELRPNQASNGTPSLASSVDILGCAVPYGTRSRNRSSTSRPNYAEDREIDTDFEAVLAGSSRKVARPSDVGNPPDAGRSLGNLRKTTQADTESSLHSQNNDKDPIPGMSIFSANPTLTTGSTVSTKKRKAANQTNQNPQVNIQGGSTQSTHNKPSACQRIAAGFRETNMMSFEKCGGKLTENNLHADDDTVLQVNDHVYLVCEPPGEPYYLGRIMEFLHVNNDSSQSIDALRLNWYYRPKDIGRKVNDTRQVFASMHSDISPLTSLRGKCQIRHKSEVDKLDDMRKIPDFFWYEKLYDRYIHRFYDVIPTSQVINVPMEVKKVLDDRWKFILVEPGRGKELTSAVKSCKRCSKYCASNDSVDCAVCENTYHMGCVSPPLLKKPSRGFAWACGPCSKAQEKKLEARNTPNINDLNFVEEDELNDEVTDSQAAIGDIAETSLSTPPAMNEAEASFNPGTAEQIHQASLWLFRYLGIHCKVEDALDYDDRIYPRASSRLGARHQANVPPWYGHPVEYVKPPESKKKNIKGGSHKKESKPPKEALNSIENDKNNRDHRPKWVMDEPPGYVNRGEDYDITNPRCTSQLLYKLPESSEMPRSVLGDREPEQVTVAEREQHIFNYMSCAAGLAKPLGLPPLSTNLLDIALEILYTHNFDSEKALDALSRVDRKMFKEPELTVSEIKKFEDGVGRFGSEWHSIKKHVKTVNPANIVRFYYTWKKTERGRLIWGNYSGRKGKKEVKKEKVEATMSGLKLQDDVADEHDDSAFDNDKAFRKKRGFQCKFCNTRNSRQWRRAPSTPAGCTVPENPNAKGSAKEKGPQLLVALCRRCAELWRRYAIQWENVDEMAKRVAQAGGRAWKRKLDEDLLKELIAANEISNYITHPAASTDFTTSSIPVAPTAPTSVWLDPPRKKIKATSEKESIEVPVEPVSLVPAKRKSATEKCAISHQLQSLPPQVPELPKLKTMPCFICGEIEPLIDQHLSCKECRMAVHRNCYGVVGDNRSLSKWTCDMCSNDKNPQVSLQYKCMLCPIEFTEKDFTESTKTSSKKKVEKERGRDRIQREQAQEAADYYRNKQIEMNKPVNPREPLKRTANNNWVHVTCAVFTPEIKFGNAKALEPSEGIPSIPATRYEETCRVCKTSYRGACVGCYQCHIPVHVECAHQAGYVLGFEIIPLKGSHRDHSNVVTIDDETGTMIAAVWCKEHVPSKSTFHRMHRIVGDSGLNALQTFVRNFKQADLTLTGTVRKATLINSSASVTTRSSASLSSSRRSPSNTSGTLNTTHNSLSSHGKLEDFSMANSETSRKICVTCHIDVSPKWWLYQGDSFIPFTSPPLTNSIEISNEKYQSKSIPVTQSQSSITTGEENPVALAAAALDQNLPMISKTQIAPLLPIEYQCHQCHWKKIKKRKFLTPSTNSIDTVRSPLTSPIVTAQNSRAETELLQTVRASHSWPLPPPVHIQNGVANEPQTYNWLHRSPVAQNTITVNQINGNCSPKTGTGGAQTPQISHSQIRQQSSPSSQHNNNIQLKNGHLSNGSPSSSSYHTHNGSFLSYSTSHSLPQSPQHLVNGGPPPHASESPFSQSNGSAHQQHHSLGFQKSSPHIHHEVLPSQIHEQNPGQKTNDSSHDGRVNGGASASPSLRNLLH